MGFLPLNEGRWAHWRDAITAENRIGFAQAMGLCSFKWWLVPAFERLVKTLHC